MSKRKRIWMELDREGLPVATADSAGELAEITGVKAVTIRSAVSHQDKRGYKDRLRRPKRWAAVYEEEECDE